MLQQDSKNPFFNKEGYPDPTAYAVIKKEEDLNKKVSLLISVLKSIIRLSGFEVVGRIAIQDVKSGKVFK